MVWIWVTTLCGYAVVTLDDDRDGRAVVIDSAWVSTDPDGRMYVNAYPRNDGQSRGCGGTHVLIAEQRRQAIGLKLIYEPPPPLPPGISGHACPLRLPRARLDGPVAGRRVLDLVAGTELTSRGPLPHVAY